MADQWEMGVLLVYGVRRAPRCYVGCWRVSHQVGDVYLCAHIYMCIYLYISYINIYICQYNKMTLKIEGVRWMFYQRSNLVVCSASVSGIGKANVI